MVDNVVDNVADRQCGRHNVVDRHCGRHREWDIMTKCGRQMNMAGRQYSRQTLQQADGVTWQALQRRVGHYGRQIAMIDRQVDEQTNIQT